MTASDYKSEICRIATQLTDVANLYTQAADHASEPELAQCLRHMASRRSRMADELLSKAGISGPPAGSFLPTPDEVWLKIRSAISDPDGAAAASARSADETLMKIVADYLHHGQPSGVAAAAATRVHDELQRDLGPTEKHSDVPENQPG